MKALVPRHTGQTVDLVPRHTGTFSESAIGSGEIRRPRRLR